MLRIVHRTDAEIKRLLGKAAEAAASDVERLAPKAPIRRGQLTSAFKAVRRTMQILFTDVGDTVKVGRLDAAEAAMQSAYDWEDPYYKAAGLSAAERSALRASTTAMSDRNVELMLRRFNTEQIPLSRQVYRTRQLASGWVDKVINLGLGRGLTAREIAQEVKGSIRPDVRGGVSYAAMRLGRTEVNNAFHTASILSTVDKPWIEGMQWHLSGSHAVPDICNRLAEDDRHDLGSGVFPRGLVPAKPHPQCLCYVAAALQDEDDFVAAFASGQYDNYFDEKLGKPEAIAVLKASEPVEIAVAPKPKDGRAALRAAPLDMNDESLVVNGMRGIDSDRDYVQQYKGVAYATTNQYLRNGSGSFLRPQIEAIDRSIAKSRLTDTIHVLRGVKDPRSIFGDRIDSDLTGLEWTDDAYLSTTTDPRISDGFAERTSSPDGGMVITMRVPKGASMLRLSNFSPDDEKISSTSAEAELLGGRGWTMRIVKDNGKVGSLRRVEVEVVSHEQSSTNPWDRA